MLGWLDKTIARFTEQRGRRLPAEPFLGAHVSSLCAFTSLVRSLEPELQKRTAIESALAERDESFFLEGYCAVCARATRFWVDRVYGFPVEGSRWPAPNWRERTICEHCQLNNRMRAALHYLLVFGHPCELDTLYITEQVTPLFEVLRRRLPRTVGSEYLGDRVPFGQVDARGIRNETLTRLSFDTGSFRYLLTFDVLEHVPNTDAALAECARVLRRSGLLVFTVPFDLTSATTLRRASIRADGSIDHHVTPEYHGDPLRQEGILSYYTFGWDLIARLRAHGFDRAAAFVYRSARLGYLGSLQVLFSARRC
jgi:SAM-dependent methyltransferase